MALTDLTRISTSGIATGSTIDSPILRKDVSLRGSQVGVTSVLFDSSDDKLNLKNNVKLAFFRSPSTNKMLDLETESGFREIFALHHMKFYVFDNDVILTALVVVPLLSSQ